jgi:hypothetical protein
MEENPYNKVLENLMSESGGNSAAALQALLPQMNSADPQIQLLMTLLARRQAAREEQEAEEVAEGANYRSGPHEPDRARSFSGSTSLSGNEHQRYQRREKVRLLFEELEELWERNEMLAAALGACAQCWGGDPGCPNCVAARRACVQCWGGDPDCPRCRDQGSPGTEKPNAQLFAACVVPAARRFRAERLKEESRREGQVRQQSGKRTVPRQAEQDLRSGEHSQEPTERSEDG